MSTSFDLSRTGILRLAYQFVGIVPAGQDPDTNQLQMGSDVLNVVIKSWENKGIYLTHVERTTTALVAGQAQYTMAANTLDIDDRTPYVSDGNGVDQPITMIPRQQYMAITDKTTQSQPTLMYVEKATTVSFFLYPVPDGTWPTITYPRVLLLSDMDSASSTTGLPSKYLRALALDVATLLAFHTGFLDRQAALEERARAAISEATNDDTERGNIRMRPSYGRRFTRF